MPHALPDRVHLPSGRVVRLALDVDAPRPAPEALLFGDAIALFDGPVRAADARTGARIDVRDLPLADFHVLRAIATRARLLEEPDATVRCANCEASFAVRPSGRLEIGPYLDDELDDPELDAPFDFDAAHEVPPIATARGRATTVRLAPRTVGEARAFLAALARPELRATGAVAAAMGVVAIGETRRASALARALSRASDEAWDAVIDLYDRAHYADRLTAQVACPSCGALASVDVPAVREAFGEPSREPEPAGAGAGAGAADGFPDLDAFESRVRAIAAETWDARGLAGELSLEVDAGPAEVDDGGVPLLGCYEPESVDPDTGVHRPPAVRLFWRTFRAIWIDEGPYDLEAEIRETIVHEADHHAAFLAGDDPVDAAERAAIERERERVVGRRELGRRARAGFAASVADFLRRTWPLWLLAWLATWLAIRSAP